MKWAFFFLCMWFYWAAAHTHKKKPMSKVLRIKFKYKQLSAAMRVSSTENHIASDIERDAHCQGVIDVITRRYLMSGRRKILS